jgi:hypothetical protein
MAKHVLWAVVVLLLGASICGCWVFDRYLWYRSLNQPVRTFRVTDYEPAVPMPPAP